jgi:hypothetical protein
MIRIVASLTPLQIRKKIILVQYLSRCFYLLSGAESERSPLSTISEYIKRSEYFFDRQKDIADLNSIF